VHLEALRTGGLRKAILLFFCLSLSSSLAAAEPSNEACHFSLKEEKPKGVNFTVQAGRIAFLCKSENFFLRGTVTRTLSWQLTGHIFESMAKELKAETMEKWPSGRLYKIKSERGAEQRTLVCGYHSRDQYSLELCAPSHSTAPGESDSSADLVKSIIIEFRKIPLDKSPLLKSAPLFASKRVFTEENETRETALLGLTLPPGYVEVTRRENRSLFTDAAGLAEIEVFYEISELALDSAIAHKVYKRSIAAFLTKQGSWKPQEMETGDARPGVTCLLFTDNNKRLSHYCYLVIALPQGEKKRYCRISFVAAFLREAVDKKKFMVEQQDLLLGWGQTILKHTP
jgi:hypothetical protein